MKAKKLLAALVSVLIVLMMLPTAAFAEGENEPVTPPTKLIVGNVTVVENESVTANVSGSGWSYDHNNATLTLNGATINGVASTTHGAGIYSEGGTLTIVSDKNTTNTVTGADGGNSAAIYADGFGNLRFSGSEKATLKATGGTVTGNYGDSYGVYALSGSVTVSGGTLEATGGETKYNSYGVWADSVKVSGGTLKATGGAGMRSYGVDALTGSVTVSGGTLTATGGEATDDSYGVYVLIGSVTVGSDNPAGAVMVANGKTSAVSNNKATQQSNSLLMQNGSGTVQGSVTLKENLTVPTGGTLTIPADATLAIPDGVTLTNNGTVENDGSLVNNGTMENTGSLVNNGTMENTGTVINMDTGNLTNNGIIENSGTLPDNVGGIVNQHVTGVTLNKNVLSLMEGETETLTATVLPENASNKSVTWSSDNPAVATVENGKVTAVKEGQATITVTTEDGGKTATCTVTVNKPAPAEYTITFDPNGGYVSYTSAVTSGHKLSALPFASKYGYTFIGWYTVNGIRVSTDMAFTGNTTLYAGWVYNSVVVPEQPVTPVQPVQPEEPEYEWISEDGGTRLYYDGEMITGWYQDEETEVWYWLDKSSGFMAADQWVKVDGTWYLFGKDGSMLTGWQKVDGKWYYLKPWGGMATGWQLIDSVWYYLRSDGSMAGNAWVQTSGQWYYLTGSGEMATACWIEWKGDWYYLYSSGAMATNATIDGYYVNSNGIWVK